MANVVDLHLRVRPAVVGIAESAGRADGVVEDDEERVVKRPGSRLIQGCVCAFENLHAVDIESDVVL